MHWRCAIARLRLRLGAAVITILTLLTPAHAGLSELMSTTEVRTENDIFNEQGLGVVDPFTGNLTSTSRDIHWSGNGGNPIEVYRRWDGSRVRARIWGIPSSGQLHGVTVEKFLPQEFAAFADRTGGWSLTAAPMVTMNVTHYPIPDMPVSMNDSVDRVCTGQAWRSNGTTGLYGVLVVYTLTHIDGRTERLVPTETGVVQSASGWRLTCAGGTGGTHTLRSPSGDAWTLGLRVWNWNTETFDAIDWSTLTVVATQKTDRNGNWLRFTYADKSEWGVARPRLQAIASSDGRQLTFDYEDFSGAGGWNAGARLARIASNAGREWRYTYGADGKLQAVSDPAGRTWRYAYTAPVAYRPGVWLMGSLQHSQPDWARSDHLQSITVPTGGRIEFAYEPSEVWGRGVWWTEGIFPEQMATDYPDLYETRANWSLRVSRKTTSDGGTWSYAYAPARSPGAYDVTTITTPSGTETHTFFGEGYFSEARMWPVNQGAYYYNWGTAQTGPMIGGVWKLGLPVEVRKGTNRVETFEWTPFTHSAIYLSATSGYVGMRDEMTYRPLLARHTIALDGAAHTTTYGNFDTYGNPQTITEAGPNGGNRTTNVTYFNDAARWIIGLRKDETATGLSTRRTFDAKGNLLSLTRDGVATSTSYDSEGNVATRTFPRGLVHTYSNYKRGIARSEVQPESVSIARTVSDAGDIESETNGDGKTTRFAYDGIGRLTSITHPAGAPKTIAYGEHERTSTRDGLVETVSYDAFARPVSATLGGVTTTWRYDALGRRTFESLPGSPDGTTFAWDNLGRITKATHGDGSYVATTYGAASRSVRNERGVTTTYTHRAYGDPDQQLVMTVTPPTGGAGPVTLARNARGLVTSVRQGSVTRSYAYDGRYYLASETHPETGVTTYTRDDAGNMTSRKVGAGPAASFAYDGHNRMGTATYGSGTASFAYTKTHKLAKVINPGAERRFRYDDNGNLTGESVIANSVSLVFTYVYNARDQLAAVVYPRARQRVDYEPDALGRPTRAGSYVSAISYWPSGQLRQVNYGNGTVASYDQNARGWPGSFRSAGANGARQLDSAYEYDAAGNLTLVSDAIDAANVRAMGYDKTDRLTTIRGPWGAGTIAYDDIGNIKNQTLGSMVLNYGYDAASNRLASVSGQRSTSFTYDTFGNVTAGSGNAYTYDAVPNLVCFNCTNAAQKIAYAYDGLNRRVRVDKGGETSYEFHDSAGNLLAEYTPTTARLVEHIYIGNKRIAQRVTP